VKLDLSFIQSNGSIGVIWTKIKFARQDLVQTTEPFLVETYGVVVLSEMKRESKRTHLRIMCSFYSHCVRKGTRTLTVQNID
jgi:hypothetical protein